MDIFKNKYQIVEFLGYNERQEDYYGNALRYLGLAKKDEQEHLFLPSNLGKKVRALPNSNQRNIILIRQILRSNAMNLIFKNTLKNGDFDDDYIIRVISNSGGIGKGTLKRRKTTARNYISWILQTATAE